MAKEKYKLGSREYDGSVIRERVKVYNNSENGKQKRKEWYEKNRERMNELIKVHLQEKRDFARKNGFCTSCFKNHPVRGLMSCQQYIDRQRRYKNESNVK